MSAPREWDGRRLHFVGIGGSGMSGLALAAQALGATVTGSDARDGRHLRQLRERGIPFVLGHAADNVPAGGELVYSSAVRPDNPERERGRELGLSELRRGELLGELSRLRSCIAVAGAHGKTTTAAMIVHALHGAGERPSYVIGGELRATGTTAEWGSGRWLVVEADESDRTFLALKPDVGVVTNVELEHHREYRSRLDFEAAFRAFLASAPRAVVWDRPRLLALRDDAAAVVPFDAPGAVLEPGGSRFEWRGIEVRLTVPGEHNARNAAAALEACRLTGADIERAARALSEFPGVIRRLEPVGSTGAGARVYDDYAHHPTEIRATLEAARTLGPRRLVAVLQPFGFERVDHLAREFGDALACADVAVVLEIYARRPPPAGLEGLSGRRIARAAADAAGGRPVVWMPDQGDAERWLRAHLRAGDLCVTLGADDMEEFARRLSAQPFG